MRLFVRYNMLKKVIPMQNRPYVYSAEEFHAILGYERARVDRNNHEFSLLMFKSNLNVRGYNGHGHNTDGSNGTLKSFLEGFTAKRLRETDVVGWYDESNLAILLPDTLADGAQKLAAEISNNVNTSANFSKCEIYTYPSHKYNSE